MIHAFLLFNSAQPGDALIIVLFTLFAASTVNERIIDFFKLQFPALWLKSFDYQDELRRHKKLWLLAFAMGIVTTAILDINFVRLLTENGDILGTSPRGLVDWLETCSTPVFPVALGYLFTALFISLGSKFWHDLLDLVLFVKNGKRKIKNFNPKGITDSQQIDRYWKEDEYAIARKALDANRKTLEKDYPGASFNVGYEYAGGQYRPCILVQRRGDERDAAADAPNSGFMDKTNRITHITEYGYAFHFPIVVSAPGPVQVVNGPGLLAEAGGGLFNTVTQNNVGTFGCIVKDKKEGCKNYYLLTCYHCVRVQGMHDWERFLPEKGQNEVQYTTRYQSPFIVGNIKAAYRDARMDIAIIEPETNDVLSDYRWFPHMTVPFGARAVTPEDAQKRTRVWFSGKTSGNSEGYIINLGYSEPVNYGEGESVHNLHNLIVFSKTAAAPYEAPCAPGDSGAIIIDAETKVALGMVVARDNYFGYAIPIQDILDVNGLALYTDPCEILPS